MQLGRSAVIWIMGGLPACYFPQEQFHGPACLGSQLLDGVCLSRTPTGDVTLPTATIDTATLGPGGCTEIVSQPAGPSLCVIAGSSIQIRSGMRIRATAEPMDPSGTNPLVLFATASIVIDGTLDVASHTADLGGGARTAMGCSSAGNGEPGKVIGAAMIGGGGGAGGSFGSKGGPGGNGGNQQPPHTTSGGTPSKQAAFRRVIGGCPGGSGGAGEASDDTGGAGGGGGGAVYLIADSITITGTINASGSGGGAGAPSTGSAGGGGGGGSGGLIGLEATTISVTGSLFASGGGGGAGFGGLQVAAAGNPGADPSRANEAARGGPGDHGGGSGGDGTPDDTDGKPGQPGSNAPGMTTPESAGGGGGGGAGVIYLLGVSPPAIDGAMISPPPMRS